MELCTVEEILRKLGRPGSRYMVRKYILAHCVPVLRGKRVSWYDLAEVEKKIMEIRKGYTDHEEKVRPVERIN